MRYDGVTMLARRVIAQRGAAAVRMASTAVVSSGVPPRDHHSGVEMYPKPFPADWHHSDRPGRVDHGYGYLPGPYFTMDEAPVPHLPFEQERAAMNVEFRKYLAVGIAFALATLMLQYDSGAFEFEKMLKPKYQADLSKWLWK